MRLRFILSEVGKGLTRNVAMTISVMLVSFVSLLFVGSSALLHMQIDTMKGAWYDKVEVSIFMCPQSAATTSCPGGEATQEQIDSVEQLLNSDSLKPYVKNYTIEDKAQAYENFMKAYGDTHIGRNATEDMMPVSFRVKLVNPEQYQVVSEQFTGRDGVDRVVDQKAVLDPLFQVMNKASWIAGGLAGVMGIAAVLLITTTIRLSAMSRSKETSIMRLVGASNLFIQLPFMIEGAIAALAGAVLAVAALWVGVHYVVEGWLSKAVFLTTAFISTSDVLIVAPFLLIAAIALAAAASAFSLAKYTKV
ncbi:permease-like cell division protein FtsX [Actinomyces vulturis]|uniref:permease-like cell division protein FtsX n=1 Tax=Actinomyces vulturis TaxID=1857645 RepID=UPI00082A9719|nr:permease-like cell division protein FtsX [Actinomyces vulturis]